MTYYLPKNSTEAQKLDEAYRRRTVIRHEGRKVRVTGMTRSVPSRYQIEPVETTQNGR